MCGCHGLLHQYRRPAGHLGRLRREAGDHVKAAALDGEAQAIEDALLD